MCVINLVTSESKDCDPKKDSGCMKFTRPFYPDECWAAFPGGPNCTRFDPMKSKTLKYVDKGMFLLQYADNSALKGYEARDVVQLGDYYTFTKFGMCKSIFFVFDPFSNPIPCTFAGGITVCNSPDFQRVNGILGFGLPQQQHVRYPDSPPFCMIVLELVMIGSADDPSKWRTVSRYESHMGAPSEYSHISPSY
jgi:hypothetical protein